MSKEGKETRKYLLASRAVDGKVTELLLGGYKPGDKRAYKAEYG